MKQVGVDLETINDLEFADSCDELLKCCRSTEWAEQLAALRPFTSFDDLKKKSASVWWSLGPTDWLEAFRSHPKIGEHKAVGPVAAESRKWSELEQAGVSRSAEVTLAELAHLNREYEAKFGYIFIVCASGKSADEMLSILRQRLQNEPDDEIRVAAAEQAKITELRIDKLLNQ